MEKSELGLVDDCVQLEKENKKEDKKVGFLDDYLKMEDEYSIFGLNNAVKFDKQRKEKNRSNSKGIVKKAVGILGKGVKTGVRFVFSPISETKNMVEATTDWASYNLRRWFK